MNHKSIFEANLVISKNLKYKQIHDTMRKQLPKIEATKPIYLS